MTDDRKLLVIYPTLSVSTFVKIMEALTDEFPDAYIITDAEQFTVMTGENQGPTDG